jgi:diguanylate cyclase (GGDEF)-like protein
MRVRITKKVFHDLALWMIAFGLLIGVAFPFFVMLLGVPREIAFTAPFFLACLGAGAVAGGVNFALARVVVGARMRLMAARMAHVKENLLGIAITGNMESCTPAECMIKVDSEDEIGESATAFNQLVEALASSMETQAAVRSFSEMLTSELELESLARHAMSQFIKHTGAAGGAILFESGGKLSVGSVHGLRNPESLAESDHVRLAVRTGESQRITLPEGVRVDGVLADFRPNEIAVLPATYKSIPVGVVILATAGSFSAEANTRMELFRHTLGLALNNAIAHESLQRLAALDPLTGVYNRRFGLNRLHEEFDRAVRLASPLGVLMFDLDHFKQVNDTYGHLVGDRLLVSITRVAKGILRDGDILIRYGGEEFLAVLPAASTEDLSFVGERLRRAIEDSSITDGSQTIRATISLGGAAYPNQSVEREDQLIQLADGALYRAKESGRNRLDLSR